MSGSPKKMKVTTPTASPGIAKNKTKKGTAKPVKKQTGGDKQKSRQKGGKTVTEDPTSGEEEGSVEQEDEAMDEELADL
jgi:hypothetical protein